MFGLIFILVGLVLMGFYSLVLIPSRNNGKRIFIKKAVIFIVGILLILSICRHGWFLMIDNGYIPFTEEYDQRLFMKYYKQNSEDFDLLIEEIDGYISLLPSDIYVDGDRVRFENEDTEWTIIILKDCEQLYQKKEVIINKECIKEIETIYDETLFGISYDKQNDSYIFNIGEYYSVCISDSGVTIR